MAVIYVGNVDCRNTEAYVRSVFEVYGPVGNIKLKSGFAVVEMADEGQAQKAISDLNSQGSWVVRTISDAA
jgi:RNA recognition motif-containing protein